MQNEIRYYLEQIKKAIESDSFVPTYLVAAIRLPSKHEGEQGAIELQINNTDLAAKIDYILEAYDEEMRLKTKHAIFIENLLIV